jgi:hypothetical protein
VQAAKAVVLLEPSVAPSPSLAAEVRAARASTPGPGLDLATTTAALLLVVGSFGLVLGRRAWLVRSALAGARHAPRDGGPE